MAEHYSDLAGPDLPQPDPMLVGLMVVAGRRPPTPETKAERMPA